MPSAPLHLPPPSPLFAKAAPATPLLRVSVTRENAERLGASLRFGSDPIEMHFDSFATLATMLARSPDGVRTLFAASGDSLALESSDGETGSLVELHGGAVAASREAMATFGVLNSVWLETYVPASAFARLSRQRTEKNFRIDHAAIEQTLTNEYYISCHADGSVTLSNRGYRTAMMQKLLEKHPAGTPLRLFRGMRSDDADIMRLLQRVARGEPATAERVVVMKHLAKYAQQANTVPSQAQLARLDDRAFSHVAFQALKPSVGYTFTTPDPRYAAKWGAVHQLDVDLGKLPTGYRERVYVAADEPGITEVDFPLNDYSEAMVFFRAVEPIKSIAAPKGPPLRQVIMPR